MPLSSALIAKLYKRGIINQANINQLNSTTPQVLTPPAFIFCPNTYNIYHDCSPYCQSRWKGFASPDLRYARNLKIALAKYPLPPKWEQVLHKGIGRYYYWNTSSDMVSWLPPNHPKATIGESAEMQRQKIRRRTKCQKSVEGVYRGGNSREYYAGLCRRSARQGDLDPMDPAAYSDVRRGCWTDGLEQNRGVADSTASGSLFQQRPYPSPGDILALNKKTRFS